MTLMEQGVLGYIDTPRQQQARPVGVKWCADNGCFSSRWDANHWWAFLERHAHDAANCLFATAPDVVGDALATTFKARPWLPRIRELGYPVAYVAQDGIEDIRGRTASGGLTFPVPWDSFDALFIGGTTEWKLGPVVVDLVNEAKQRGKWVHMGRVNSRKRWKYAEQLGCDSADGTFLTFGPDKNLPRLLRWFE